MESNTKKPFGRTDRNQPKNNSISDKNGSGAKGDEAPTTSRRSSLGRAILGKDLLKDRSKSFPQANSSTHSSQHSVNRSTNDESSWTILNDDEEEEHIPTHVENSKTRAERIVGAEYIHDRAESSSHTKTAARAAGNSVRRHSNDEPTGKILNSGQSDQPTQAENAEPQPVRDSGKTYVKDRSESLSQTKMNTHAVENSGEPPSNKEPSQKVVHVEHRRPTHAENPEPQAERIVIKKKKRNKKRRGVVREVNLENPVPQGYIGEDDEWSYDTVTPVVSNGHPKPLRTVALLNKNKRKSTTTLKSDKDLAEQHNRRHRRWRDRLASRNKINLSAQHSVAPTNQVASHRSQDDDSSEATANHEQSGDPTEILRRSRAEDCSYLTGRDTREASHNASAETETPSKSDLHDASITFPVHRENERLGDSVREASRGNTSKSPPARAADRQVMRDQTTRTFRPNDASGSSRSNNRRRHSPQAEPRQSLPAKARLQKGVKASLPVWPSSKKKVGVRQEQNPQQEPWSPFFGRKNHIVCEAQDKGSGNQNNSNDSSGLRLKSNRRRHAPNEFSKKSTSAEVGRQIDTQVSISDYPTNKKVGIRQESGSHKEAASPSTSPVGQLVSKTSGINDSSVPPLKNIHRSHSPSEAAKQSPPSNACRQSDFQASVPQFHSNKQQDVIFQETGSRPDRASPRLGPRNQAFGPAKDLFQSIDEIDADRPVRLIEQPKSRIQSHREESPLVHIGSDQPILSPKNEPPASADRTELQHARSSDGLCPPQISRTSIAMLDLAGNAQEQDVSTHSSDPKDDDEVVATAIGLFRLDANSKSTVPKSSAKTFGEIALEHYRKTSRSETVRESSTGKNDVSGGQRSASFHQSLAPRDPDHGAFRGGASSSQSSNGLQKSTHEVSEARPYQPIDQHVWSAMNVNEDTNSGDLIVDSIEIPEKSVIESDLSDCSVSSGIVPHNHAQSCGATSKTARKSSKTSSLYGQERSPPFSPTTRGAHESPSRFAAESTLPESYSDEKRQQHPSRTFGGDQSQSNRFGPQALYLGEVHYSIGVDSSVTENGDLSVKLYAIPGNQHLHGPDASSRQKGDSRRSVLDRRYTTKAYSLPNNAYSRTYGEPDSPRRWSESFLPGLTPQCTSGLRPRELMGRTFDLDNLSVVAESCSTTPAPDEATRDLSSPAIHQSPEEQGEENHSRCTPDQRPDEQVGEHELDRTPAESGQASSRESIDIETPDDQPGKYESRNAANQASVGRAVEMSTSPLCGNGNDSPETDFPETQLPEDSFPETDGPQEHEERSALPNDDDENSSEDGSGDGDDSSDEDESKPPVPLEIACDMSEDGLDHVSVDGQQQGSPQRSSPVPTEQFPDSSRDEEDASETTAVSPVLLAGDDTPPMAFWKEKSKTTTIRRRPRGQRPGCCLANLPAAFALAKKQQDKDRRKRGSKKAKQRRSLHVHDSSSSDDFSIEGTMTTTTMKSKQFAAPWDGSYSQEVTEWQGGTRKCAAARRRSRMIYNGEIPACSLLNVLSTEAWRAKEKKTNKRKSRFELQQLQQSKRRKN